MILFNVDLLVLWVCAGQIYTGTEAAWFLHSKRQHWSSSSMGKTPVKGKNTFVLPMTLSFHVIHLLPFYNRSNTK